MESIKQIIKEIKNDNALTRSVSVIKNSFQTVALEFGLTEENCPTHPSFLTIEKLIELRSKGARFFGLFLENKQVGFVSIEQANAALYYMEKLAVIPECRHNGYGLNIVNFVLDFVMNRGGQKISIGIIDEHTILKEWYKKIGFVELSTKKFPHLPFTVCFMERNLIYI